MLPLLRTAPLVSSLHSGGRAQTASRSRHRLRHVLMGAQVALALVLLVFSGLMVRSFQNLRAMDPGFDPHSALTFRVGLTAREYPDRAAVVAAHHALLDRLAALPGVTAASATSCLPLVKDADCFGNTLFVDGRPFPTNALPPAVSFRAVAGDYFKATGIRLIRGRGIDRQRRRSCDAGRRHQSGAGARVFSGSGSDRPAHRVERLAQTHLADHRRHRREHADRIH